MKSSRWTKAALESERQSVKTALDKLASHAEQLEFLLKEISQLEDDGASQGLLRRFVCAIYALLLHRRKSGLKPLQIERLASLGAAILTAQGIRPKTSQLAFLHRDLHLILSQIYSNQGERWKAAWEQHLSFHLSHGAASDEEFVQSLSMGIRASRLGQGEVAFSALNQAAKRLPKASLIRLRIEEIRLLRLCNEPQKANALLAVLIKDSSLSPAEKQELSWEGILIGALFSRNLLPMVNAVSLRGSHSPATYFLDAFFYTRSTSETSWLSRFQSLHERTRGFRKELLKLGEYYKAARCLRDLYDERIPFTQRLIAASEIPSYAGKMITSERELLLWASLARWLIRSRQHELATLTLFEYRSLSLKISSGRCDDSLFLMRDCLDAEWFLERIHSSALGRAA